MSFEMNKIAGAILGTLLLVMGLGFLAEAIYAPIEGRGPGYTLPEPEEGDTGEVVEEVAATPLPVLLASASAEDGAGAVRKCASCHNFGEGEGNKTGPALYDIVGAEIAAHEGFAYSDALVAYGAEHGNWTYETLAEFIHDPRGSVQGTKMTFAGIRDEEELADILAYFQTLSADPVPFPAVEDVADEAPAEGDTMAEAPAEGDAVTDEPAAVDLATEEAAPEVSDEPVAVEEDAIAEDPATEDPTEDVPDLEAPAAEETAAEEPVADEPAAEEPAAEDAAAEETAAAGGSELEAAIAAASLDDGASAMRSCRACHDWVEGGRNKVGPLLYDIVGNDVAAVEGYSYSAGMLAFAEENPVWTYELLDQFLADPRGTVQGTKMTFAGIRDAEDRAAAIALLRSESPDPAPLAGAE